MASVVAPALADVIDATAMPHYRRGNIAVLRQPGPRNELRVR